MQIEIDANSGFCFGVINAIALAEEELQHHQPLYCLGEIVHNNAELKRLEAKGLITIHHDELEKFTGQKVMIRAHGEPPETFRKAYEHHVRIIDATCPVVLRLQQKIKKCYATLSCQPGIIVIYGKKGHPEVNGLVGQTGGTAIVIGSAEEANVIDVSLPIHLFSQTTMDKEKYIEVARVLRKKMQQTLQQEKVPLTVYQTICGAVANRVPELRKFAHRHDVILFVSGKESSNGKVLYEVCKSENPRTYFISDISEIQPAWFTPADHVGICGATSTPRWQMEQVAEWLHNL